MATITSPTTPSTITFTLNVWGRHAGQDHTYTYTNRKDAYRDRDFWIAEGYTARVNDPLLPR